MKSWSQDNYIEMNSRHNEEKSVFAEKFIITLENIYEYMTSVPKNVFIDKLDDIISKYKASWCIVKHIHWMW